MEIRLVLTKKYLDLIFSSGFGTLYEDIDQGIRVFSAGYGTLYVEDIDHGIVSDDPKICDEEIPF